MVKNVLIISSSWRKGGNSDTLADEFVKGANDAGHKVEKINLAGKTINFCRGCLSCQKTFKCVLKDDAEAIVEKMQNADVLVFATPIYYYEMSGLLKTMLDRANPLFAQEYKFREVYLLTAAADTDDATPDNAINGVKGWVACFENAEFKGSVFGGGVTNIGDIKGNAALVEAYEMGKNV